ncbi:hypothetical protein BGW38_004116, partial [Lunasporangiospora selenospora]
MAKPRKRAQGSKKHENGTSEADQSTHSNGASTHEPSQSNSDDTEHQLNGKGSSHTSGSDSESSAVNGHDFSAIHSNTPTPIYRAIRFFFNMCLHSFYAHVEVEGTENIAPDNYPAIL